MVINQKRELIGDYKKIFLFKRIKRFTTFGSQRSKMYFQTRLSNTLMAF